MKAWKAIIGGVIVAGLFHVLLWKTDTVGTVVMFPAFLGVVAHLFIEGPHGGSETDFLIASIVEVLLNSLLYSVLLWGAPRIHRRISN